VFHFIKNYLQFIFDHLKMLAVGWCCLVSTSLLVFLVASFFLAGRLPMGRSAVAWGFVVTAKNADGVSVDRCAVWKDGKQCLQVFPAGSTTSHIKQHLLSHKIADLGGTEAKAALLLINDNNPKQKQLEQVGLAHFDVMKEVIEIDTESVETRCFDLFAAASLPFWIVDFPEFRALVPLPRGVSCRQSFTIKFIEAGKEIRDSAIKALRLSKKCVTIGLDSGTVWNRYLCCVAMAPGLPAIVFDIAHDGVFNGTLTAVNIAKHLSRLLRTTLEGVNVVAFVGDNAANVQRALLLVDRNAAADDEPAADVDRLTAFAELVPGAPARLPQLDTSRGWKSAGGHFRIRCLAHSLQLVVRGFIAAQFPTLEERLRIVAEELEVSAKIVETRWNTVYLVLVDVLKVVEKISNADDVSLFRDAHEALRPFYLATEEAQKGRQQVALVGKW
jgi:hypothetical protein